MDIINRIHNRISSFVNRARIYAARACLPRLNNLDDGLFSLVVSSLSGGPSEDREVRELIKIALESAHSAIDIDISDVSARINIGPKWPDIWPGEHYRFLAALIEYLQPTTVVEIGTFLGLSALAMKKYLPEQGRIVTFDILPWQSFSQTCLRESDFADRRLRQELGDLADPTLFKKHEALFSKADVIFLDGPKNRIFERAFLERLKSTKLSSPSLLVIDDIRLWSMLDIWKAIPFPKIDATSFGHFSGTGLVKLK